MPPRIKYTPDENTDRDFPNALEVFDAEFKVNGEYVCVEPCGGGSGQHLLGDVHIYVETWGDDSFPDARDPVRTGTSDDPFATIQRAIDYVVDIVTINGTIYIHIGAGTFYISKQIHISHPNKIEFVGKDNFVSSIHFGDYSSCNIIAFWYGGNVFFMYASQGFDGDYVPNEGIDTFHMDIGGTAHGWGDVYERNIFRMACAGKSIGIFGGGDNFRDKIEYITFSIQNSMSYFGELLVPRRIASACSDGTIGVFGGGQVSTNDFRSRMDKITFDILSTSSFFGDFNDDYQPNSSSTAACSNDVTGTWSGGIGSYSTFGGYVRKILMAVGVQTVTMGELITPRGGCVGTSNRTIGIITGGHTKDGINGAGTGNVVIWNEYFMFSSTATVQEFSNLTTEKSHTSPTSNENRAVFSGGSLYSSVGIYDTIEYTFYDTKANNTEYGNLTRPSYDGNAVSGN